MADGSAPATPPELARPLARKVGWRPRLSRFVAQVQTALGTPKGFFIQYPYTRQHHPVSEPYPEVEALCAASPWRETLNEIASHRSVFSRLGENPTDPILGRGMFPPADGMATYAMVRKHKPRRVLEIGSGNSTYFLARAVKDNGVGQITCIDPQPRCEITALNVDFKPRLMVNSDATHAGLLEADDILFIDSSHIMLPGMDVDIEFNRLFPRLKRGVLVHVHDIFLPDDYPASWRTRNYSEQNALIGWIVSGFFKIVWPGHYVLARHHADLKAALGDLLIRNTAGSLWLRKT